MIREVEGDILLSGAQVIAHGIAPQDHFDSGLALALRERWPSMVRDYRHAAHARAPEPGGIWVWAGVDEQGKTQCIVNLITQGMLHSGRSAKPGKASLEDVGHALRELARYVRSEGVSSLALLRGDGSGRAGLVRGQAAGGSPPGRPGDPGDSLRGLSQGRGGRGKAGLNEKPGVSRAFQGCGEKKNVPGRLRSTLRIGVARGWRRGLLLLGLLDGVLVQLDHAVFHQAGFVGEAGLHCEGGSHAEENGGEDVAFHDDLRFCLGMSSG